METHEHLKSGGVVGFCDYILVGTHKVIPHDVSYGVKKGVKEEKSSTKKEFVPKIINTSRLVMC
jgi:hypothetical protein